MQIVNDVKSMRATIRGIVLNKFLKLDPTSYESYYKENIKEVHLSITLISGENKLSPYTSFVDVVLKDNEARFIIKERRGYNSDIKWEFTDNSKEVRQLSNSFFVFKSNEEEYNNLKYILENMIPKEDLINTPYAKSTL